MNSDKDDFERSMQRLDQELVEAGGIGVIFDRYANGRYDTTTFDTLIYLFLCKRDVQLDSPYGVRVFWFTRMLQWEVENGGYAQVAMGYPEYLIPAAEGFEAMGQAKIGALTRKAAMRAGLEKQTLVKALSKGLEAAFAYFRRGTFDDLDAKLDDSGLLNHREVESVRVAFACQHRLDFEAFDRMTEKQR